MRESLQYGLVQRALEGVTDNHTIKAYKREVKSFADWAKADGLKSRDAINKAGDKETLQKYADSLVERNLSPATVHSYLAPVCKALDVRMSEITKPKRTIDKITRSRGEKNERGQREASDVKHERLVNFQKAVGIRRSELAKLKPDCLSRSADGALFVHVERGKGGKEQFQRVLPKDEQIVIQTVRESTGKTVFSRQEMKNKIDLHSMRADHARECLNYYSNKLEQEPDFKAKCNELLLNYFKQQNVALSPEKYKSRLKAFKEDIGKNNFTYRLRGKTAQIAREKGLPLVYDRRAIMLVSVFHLSHWRCDVTVTNYLIK